MSIAEKLTTIAENQQRVYDAGFSAGQAQGGNGGYDEGYIDGWNEGSTNSYNNGYDDGLEEGYNKANDENPLCYATRIDNIWGGAVFPENYEAVIRFKKAPSNFTYAFNNADNLKSVKLTSEDKSNIVAINHSFRIADTSRARLEVVDFADFNKCFSSLQETFRWQVKLRSILGAMDLSACTGTSVFSNTFWDCNALEDIEIVTGTIKISISFAYSPLLTDASIQSIIDGLADLTGATAQTITFHKDVGAKLTDAQKTAIALKNWTLAY